MMKYRLVKRNDGKYLYHKADLMLDDQVISWVPVEYMFFADEETARKFLQDTINFDKSQCVSEVIEVFEIANDSGK